MSLFSSHRRSTLFIDVSVIVRHDAGTGIQRVVRTLGELLHQRGQAHFVVRFIRASRRLPFRFADESFLGQPRRFMWNRWLVRPRRGDIFLGLDLALRTLPSRAASIQRWRDRGAKVALFVYDLLPLSRPDWFEENLTTAFRRWADFMARHCDHAICISNAVRDQCLRFVEGNPAAGVHEMRVTAMHLGGNLLAAKAGRSLMDENERAIMSTLAERPFVLTVGTLEPRKGHAELLAAFDELERIQHGSPFTLVFAGRPGWRTQELQTRIRSHGQLGERLRWIDSASDAMINALYSAASGVIVPSHGEGFGLPLAEAATHGKKILARDLPVFREQRASSVSFFSDDEPKAFAECILDWFHRVEYADPANQPLTWDEAVEELLQALCLTIRDAIPIDDQDLDLHRQKTPV